MSQTRAKSPARAGLKWMTRQLITHLADDRMRRARCKLFPDLPWTSDTQPARPVLRRMEECCAGCPVRDHCGEIGVHALGGMYAGVWLPWKTDKGIPGVRTARGVLRARVGAQSDYFQSMGL